MKTRCYNRKTHNYKNYGGRGIKACPRWLDSFENFFADMGQRPTALHTLERRDSNADYSPENCIWATKTQQGRNRSVVRLNTEAAKVIRFMRLRGIEGALLARLHGVSASAVCSVHRGHTWREGAL